MRKTDYIQLYPMVRIALMVIAVIWIGYDCFGWFTCRYEWGNKQTTYKAFIVSPVTKHEQGLRCDLMLTDCEPALADNIGTRIKAFFHIDANSTDTVLKIGDGLTVCSCIKSLDGKTVPNHKKNFDYNEYLKIHGYAGTTFIHTQCFHRQRISLQSLSIIERTKLKMLIVRERLLSMLHSRIGSKEFPIVAAMTLGNKYLIDNAMRDTFSKTGVSHLLALSGLHISIIFSFIMLIFTPVTYSCRHSAMRHVLIAIVTIIPIWIYVLLVGLPVSAVRSAVMITIYGLVAALGRNRLSLNTIALAAIIILAFNPLSLFDVGFQMSFLALIGIHVFYPVLYASVDDEWLQMHTCFRWFWSASLISVSAQAATAPLVAYYFGTFSSSFLLANYIAIPLSTLILYCSCLFFLATPFAIMQLWIGNVITAIVALLTTSLKFIGSLPYSSFQEIQISRFQVVLLYIMTAEFFWFWHCNKANRLKLLLATILVYIIYTTFAS